MSKKQKLKDEIKILDRDVKMLNDYIDVLLDLNSKISSDRIDDEFPIISPKNVAAFNEILNWLSRCDDTGSPAFPISQMRTLTGMAHGSCVSMFHNLVVMKYDRGERRNDEEGQNSET